MAGADRRSVLRRTGSAETLRGGVESFPVDYVEGADAGYRWYSRTGAKPLFAFGHGLSYTRFAYAGLTVVGGATPRVSFTVTNTGGRAGSDVPQVYALIARADGKPVPRLVGFERVTLRPGETRTVSVTLDRRLLARYDAARHGWTVAGGAIPIAVGHNAGDAVLESALDLSTDFLNP